MLGDGVLSFDTGKEAGYPLKLCEVYAGATSAYFEELKGDLIPAAPSCRAGWVLNKLFVGTIQSISLNLKFLMLSFLSLPI